MALQATAVNPVYAHMSLDILADHVWRSLVHAARTIASLLLAPASDLSIGSLLVALLIATLWLSRRHHAARRKVRLKALARLLFPKRWRSARSAGLDLKLFLLNTFVFGSILAGAVVSHRLVAGGTRSLLDMVATPGPAAIGDFAATLLLTVSLFLAYELSYWVHHYLSHTIPALWEMHKVHHSAEVLTPLTNSRVHPIEGVIFLNCMALFLGVTEASVTWALGHPVQPLTIGNANLIVVVFTYLLAHLHHTHVWIPLTGVWGRLIISPAHHQIHHSANPIHFNKNMGSVLAVFDWLFGTLHVPERKRERLVFGLGAEDVTEHSVTQELLRPVTALAEAGTRVAGAMRGAPTADGARSGN